MSNTNNHSQLAAPKRLSNSAEATVREILGRPHELTLLSRSHNLVYRVTSDSGRYVVKEICAAAGVNAFLEKAILEKIPSADYFRPVLHVQRLADTGTCLVISPYIEGNSLDVVIRQATFSRKEARLWAAALHRIFCRLRSIPAEGFGKATLGKAASFETWTNFLAWYLKRQGEKGPRLAKMRFTYLWHIFSSLREALDAETPAPKVINADINARNFLIVSQTNRLCQIHMPNVQYGDAAVPYGDAMIHFHGTSIVDELQRLCRFPAWRLHFYAAFSAYAVLAYTERVGATPLEEAVAWGGARPLLELLDEQLEAVKS